MVYFKRSNFIADFTSESQAIPEQPCGKACNCEAKVGHGVQGIPGLRRWIHELPGAE